MIDERDKMLITAKNMIAKLRDSQADTEEKLIHYKQRSSQKTAKDSSYTDIQSHEEMLRGEIYSLHEKLDMLSRAADDELKSKSETIEKLTQENQSINRSFGDLEMKLRDIESESKARDEKYMEIVNEKEFEISSLMKETQEQMQLKDLEISQMKKSLNTIANINFDSDRTHYTSQKQGHKSTPNKRKSPIKTYSKAATEMVNRPDPKLECEESQDLEITVHDLDQESQLPLIDF